MSFGERAALEGILAQVKPTLAIEIGTAEGGSLARIATHSREVHSIDLSHEELTVEPASHVHLHNGPSAQLLPDLLARFARDKRTVDFALVDGDHSFAGVVGDVQALLGSPTTPRSVILIHDSMNEEVRAGIESIAFDEYEKVVYHELDFVAGYVYREGVAAEAVWGGLALVLCDTRRSRAYTSSTRQWRYHEPYAAIHRMRAQRLAASSGDSSKAAEQSTTELERMSAQLSVLEADLKSHEHALTVLYGSRSWRLTRPLRACARLLRSTLRPRRGTH